MGCTFCGADFTLGRSCKDTPPTCGDSCPPGFVPLFWDEGLGAPTPCGMTDEDGSCDVTSLVAMGAAVSSTVGVLQQPPIGRRKDLVEARVDDFWYARRMGSRIYRRVGADTRVPAFLEVFAKPARVLPRAERA